MPPRLEQELDPVTLHNQALMHMDEDPTGGFEKLNFLLQQPPTPPEAFGNLLLLYVKYEYYDVAADLLAENQGAAYTHLTPVSAGVDYIHDIAPGMQSFQTENNDGFYSTCLNTLKPPS
jgi:hypothetical protein